MPNLTSNNVGSWFDIIWEALHEWQDAHEGRAAVGTETYEERWDDICTAMAWLAEELGETET